jgi:hypothetical protein
MLIKEALIKLSGISQKRKLFLFCLKKERIVVLFGSFLDKIGAISALRKPLRLDQGFLKEALIKSQSFS